MDSIWAKNRIFVAGSMKIITYNVNGIREAMNKGLAGWVARVDPDVLCVQETKAQPDPCPVFLELTDNSNPQA